MKSPDNINMSKGPEGRDEYLSAVEGLLKRGKEKDALLIIKNAMKEMQDDPFINSYYGCLTAIVDRRASAGAKLCKDSIAMFKRSQPLGGFIFPVFYLNLGRCYIAGGNKKKALEVFKEGLKMDAEHPNILNEIKKLGKRKKPPISFLSRGNPLNKYIGLLLSKIKG